MLVGSANLHNVALFDGGRVQVLGELPLPEGDAAQVEGVVVQGVDVRLVDGLEDRLPDGRIRAVGARVVAKLLNLHSRASASYSSRALWMTAWILDAP